MERHDIDPFSLVFGVLFGAIGLAFLVAHPDVSAFRWIWPIPILALGALVVALSLRGERRTGDGEAEADARR